MKGVALELVFAGWEQGMQGCNNIEWLFRLDCVTSVTLRGSFVKLSSLQCSCVSGHQFRGTDWPDREI